MICKNGTPVLSLSSFFPANGYYHKYSIVQTHIFVPLWRHKAIIDSLSSRHRGGGKQAAAYLKKFF